MATITTQMLTCDFCGVQIDQNGQNYILLPEGDLDQHGIWDGLAGHYIWFKGQTFHSLLCLYQWIQLQHNELVEKDEAQP